MKELLKRYQVVCEKIDELKDLEMRESAVSIDFNMLYKEHDSLIRQIKKLKFNQWLKDELHKLDKK